MEDNKKNSSKTLQDSNLKRILTCGTYDLFHLGHLNQLKQGQDLNGAIKNGLLVAGVSSDFLNIKKKQHLPVVPLYQRIQIIKALDCVGEVFVEEEYDTSSKEYYSELYQTSIFTIGDDWKGRFDDLTGRGNIEQVVYLPRTPNLSTTQTVKTIGEPLPFDLYQIKPNLCSRLTTMPYKIFVTTKEISNLINILPFIPMFKSKNVFWSPSIWADPTFCDLNYSNVGSLYNGGEVDLILTDQFLESNKKDGIPWAGMDGYPGWALSYSQIVISRQYGNYILDFYLKNRLIVTESLSPNHAFTIATAGGEIWKINQRLNEETITRKNVMVKLLPDCLNQYREKIIEWSKKYNLVIIPSSEEKGIACPGSTLHYIFWNTIHEGTAQFVTILPTNYFIYEPNLYFDGQMLVSDQFDGLAFEFIQEVYGVNLSDSLINHIKETPSLQHVQLISTSPPSGSNSSGGRTLDGVLVKNYKL